jgi:putative ATPase
VSDQHNLFQANESEKPLAERMRPRTVDEFVGQDHILGEGKLLRRSIQADMLTSVIFSGPPGTGKTTLARVIANTTRSKFLSLNAVLSGVKDVREAIEEAKRHRELYGRRTILFVDEVHRWNKAQQDALLPWVENGTVVLIGATTENPFFEVNAPLVSRSRVFQLTSLGQEELYRIAREALNDTERGYGNLDVVVDDDALDHLVNVADGDARSLLNALQLAVETTPEQFPPPRGTRIHVTREVAEDSIQRRAILYDKEGDYHFDTISAFIKSLRGSDADAALYWLARMISAGEDPRYIFRRMLILASEDVGLADPQALVTVEAAARAFDRVGMPEGQFHLSEAALYLATCPKSNSTMGYFDAVSAVEEEQRAEVPKHLRDANRDAKGFGHGKGYLYPHAYTDHWVAQNYLPGALRDRVFYQPSDQGYEASVREEVQRRREIQLSLMTEPDEDVDVLSFTPPHRGRERWLSRLAEARGLLLGKARDRLTAGLKRHETVLVGGSSPLPLLWEAVRRTPEGGVYAALASTPALEAARAQAEQMPELERPALFAADILALLEGDTAAAETHAGPHAGPGTQTGAPNRGPGTPAEGAGPEARPDTAVLPAHFDRIVGRNVVGRRAEKAEALSTLAGALNHGGLLALAESVPQAFRRLSGLAREAGAEAPLVEAAERAEARLFADPENELLGWEAGDLAGLARKAGLEEVSVETREYTDSRTVREEDLRAWVFGRPEHGRAGPPKTGRADSHSLRPATHSYASYLAEELTPDELETLFNALCAAFCNRDIEWPTQVAFLTARGAEIPQTEARE